MALGKLKQHLQNRLSKKARQDDSEQAQNTDQADNGDNAAESGKPDLWQRAFENLQPDQQSLIKAIPIPKPRGTDNTPNTDDTVSERLSALKGIVEAVENQYKTERTRSKMRDSAHKILTSVLCFKDLVAQVVKFDPTGYATSAWAIVSLGMTITQNYHDQKLAWFESSVYLADVLAQYSIAEDLYRKTNPNIDQYVEDSITRVYQAVLEYTAQVMAFHKRGSVARLGKTITDIPLSEMKKSVEEEKTHLDRWTTMAQHQKQEEWAGEILTGIDNLKSSIQSLDDKLEFSQLPIAPEAQYNATEQDEAGNEECLKGTRTDLLKDIMNWVANPDSKSTFWLQGMAGTGKSTVSRTVARMLDEQELLGGSFFFKRGGRDRANAGKLFTTITKQMMVRLPILRDSVKLGIQENPGPNLKDQFKKLFFNPLKSLDLRLERPLILVIVVDALDECEVKKDIKDFLSILPDLHDLVTVKMRFFITSRPEIEIRNGFRPIDRSEVILHAIEPRIVGNDISLFMRHRFKEMGENLDIKPGWPGEEAIQRLAKMANPLFIYAATICRFIGDTDEVPADRLEAILSSQGTGSGQVVDSEYTKLSEIYLPVLQHIVSKKKKIEAETWMNDFQQIVGSIVLLSSPLSQSSLAKLICFKEETVRARLTSLHSVLFVPNDESTPVRLLHLSFREFLVDQSACDKFWVDEKAAHTWLAVKCVEVMQRQSNGLQRDICRLSKPGVLNDEIESTTVQERIPDELQYACRYWIHHSLNGVFSKSDQELAYSFLETHFLHWLEAMSILGWCSETIEGITALESLLKNSEKQELLAFVSDARRFILRHRYIVEIAPLQLYFSALFFTPKSSIVRAVFEDQTPEFIKLSATEDDWGPLRQTLEGHSECVNSVAFSPDGKILASALDDGTIRFWDFRTGTALDTLEDTSAVTDVDFSPNGQLLVSCSHDNEIRIWDTQTGIRIKTLEGHPSAVTSVAFSPLRDMPLLASGSTDRTVRLWELNSNDQGSSLILKGHDSKVICVAFSRDGQRLASGAGDGKVILWDANVATQQRILEGHTRGVSSVAFSPDGRFIASGSSDKTVRIWDARTGKVLRILDHPTGVNSVSFSPDSQKLACGADDSRVRIWDTESGDNVQALTGHASMVTEVIFSNDGGILASSSCDGTVRLWDMNLNVSKQRLPGDLDAVRSIAFSSDGGLLVTISKDETFEFWDAKSGDLRHSSEAPFLGFSKLTLSPNGDWLAANARGSIMLWDTSMTSDVPCLWVIPTDEAENGYPTFSADGQWLAMATGNVSKSVLLWNMDSIFSSDGKPRRLWRAGEGYSWGELALSRNGEMIASAGVNGTIELWDLTLSTDEPSRIITDRRHGTDTCLAFSPNCSQLAKFARDRVKLWSTESGNLMQEIPLDRNFRTMRYSDDGTRIITEQGFFNIESMPMDGSTLEERLRPPENVIFKNEWLYFNDERLMWLPADFRPRISNNVTTHQGTMGLTTPAGRVLCLRFDYDQLRRRFGISI